MAVEPEHHPISVSEASDLAKSTLRRTGTLCVIGEVSGFRGQARGGHCYFEIKDEEATLAAMLPGICTGYDAEKLAEYKKSPAHFASKYCGPEVK